MPLTARHGWRRLTAVRVRTLGERRRGPGTERAAGAGRDRRTPSRWYRRAAAAAWLGSLRRPCPPRSPTAAQAFASSPASSPSSSSSPASSPAAARAAGLGGAIPGRRRRRPRADAMPGS